MRTALKTPSRAGVLCLKLSRARARTVAESVRTSMRTGQCVPRDSVFTGAVYPRLFTVGKVLLACYWPVLSMRLCVVTPLETPSLETPGFAVNQSVNRTLGNRCFAVTAPVTAVRETPDLVDTSLDNCTLDNCTLDTERQRTQTTATGAG